MLEFAKAQDISTKYLIQNLHLFYENKVETLQKEIDDMLSYFDEANRIIAARNNVERKKGTLKRQSTSQ